MVFGLLCAVVAWNFYPPWIFERPGRPVCVEFHPLKWEPVMTNELARPSVFFDLQFAGDVAICVVLALCLALPRAAASAPAGLTRGE
jgi:hypothetical protein